VTLLEQPNRGGQRRIARSDGRIPLHSKTTQIYAHYQPSDQEADTVDRAFA
jgi:hypothetical protein